MSRTMLTISTFKREDVPMWLDPCGRLEFSKPGGPQAFVASVRFEIKADAPDEWEITGATIGDQRVTGVDRLRFLAHGADFFEAKIADHIGEHLGDALESAREDAREFATT